MCVVQSKHSWNSVERHTYRSVDVLRTVSFRLWEIPILEDNAPDSFPEKICSRSLAVFSLHTVCCNMSACIKSYVGHLQPWWCKWLRGIVRHLVPRTSNPIIQSSPVFFSYDSLHTPHHQRLSLSPSSPSSSFYSIFVNHAYISLLSKFTPSLTRLYNICLTTRQSLV